MYDVTRATEHYAWYPETEAREHYREDDRKTREGEARQKPVNPLPGGDEFAPSWVDYGTIPDDYTRRQPKPRYDDLIDAGLSDAFLSPETGGTGKANPMDTVAETDRVRGFRAYYGDDRAASFIDTKRTMSDGTRFVVPVGASVWRKPLMGKLKYLKRFSDPTGNAAIASVDGAPKGAAKVLIMTRGKLSMWLEIHKVLVERAKITDNGRTAVLESMIAGIEPGKAASLRIYSDADLKAFRHVPKRYKKGAFGDYIRFVANI
jgi:hypothetical protein